MKNSLGWESAKLKTKISSKTMIKSNDHNMQDSLLSADRFPRIMCMTWFLHPRYRIYFKVYLVIYNIKSKIK